MAAMPSPFDALVGAPLNHLLRANHWARESLKPYSSKTVSVRCPPFSASLRIVDSGEVTPAAAGATPDATLSVTPGLLLRMATRDDTAWRDIAIEGDPALAGAVHHLWRHLRWDAEEDLSRVFGDIAAHRMTGTAQAMGQWALMSGENLVRSFTEYWTEERPAVAATNDVSRFATDVDLLRDDLARLEKRISRLAAR
jgi:ubiquinone biosynthesis protein UbiJ